MTSEASDTTAGMRCSLDRSSCEMSALSRMSFEKAAPRAAIAWYRALAAEPHAGPAGQKVGTEGGRGGRKRRGAEGGRAEGQEERRKRT